MHLAILTAVALVAVTGSQAEARARVKFRLSSTATAAPSKPVPAPARSEGSRVLPAVALGAVVGGRVARSRDDVTTSSTSPTGAVTPLAPSVAMGDPANAAATPKPTKPVFVCASERKVGAGSGFCEIN